MTREDKIKSELLRRNIGIASIMGEKRENRLKWFEQLRGKMI